MRVYQDVEFDRTDVERLRTSEQAAQHRLDVAVGGKDDQRLHSRMPLAK